MTTRTPDEIVERINATKAGDLFGAEIGGLIVALDFEHAKQFLIETAKAEEWEVKTLEQIRQEAREYLGFAMGKAEDHRGLSAGRSVDHYRGWVWLLEPERFDEFEAVDYPNYGAPKLKAAAQILGFEEEWDSYVSPGSALDRMSQGLACDSNGCYEGCGR